MLLFVGLLVVTVSVDRPNPNLGFMGLRAESFLVLGALNLKKPEAATHSQAVRAGAQQKVRRKSRGTARNLAKVREDFC